MIIEEVKELQILDEFRKIVKDLEQDDCCLRRFLRARNHDLIQAELMLRKMLDWRKVNDVNNALSWKIDEYVVQEFPMEFPGTDFSNRAVAYIPAGAFNVRLMIEKGYKEEMLKFIYVCLERLMENIEKSGEQQFTVIVDLEGMTYWKVAHYETIQMTLKVFRDFEAGYPERLGEALVINAPLVLNYVWPLIKPLLTGHTLQKVKFLGSNCVKYIPQLLERMPASSLPEKLIKLMKENDLS